MAASRQLGQKSRLGWPPSCRWRRLFSIVYITKHPPPLIQRHNQPPHLQHSTIMYTIKYSMACHAGNRPRLVGFMARGWNFYTCTDFGDCDKYEFCPGCRSNHCIASHSCYRDAWSSTVYSVKTVSTDFSGNIHRKCTTFFSSNRWRCHYKFFSKCSLPWKSLIFCKG